MIVDGGGGDEEDDNNDDDDIVCFFTPMLFSLSRHFTHPPLSLSTPPPQYKAF